MNTNTETPLVSVVIATYRRDNYLKNALISLATQTYKNIEIVLVDDNVDKIFNYKVLNIVNEIKEKYKIDIKYFINEINLGSAKTRNFGVKKSSGKYITFLDDDDIYLPNKVENQINDFIKTDADFGLTDLKLYNEKNVLIEYRKRNYLNDFNNNDLLKYHLCYHMTGTDTFMFKKEYFEHIGGFGEIDQGDEFYLMENAILSNGKFVYTPTCDIKAIVHSNEAGLSSGESKIKCENILYKHKQNYFYRLDRKAIKYIKMRHYAVLAFAYMRMKKFSQLIINTLKSLFASPTDFMKLFAERK